MKTELYTYLEYQQIFAWPNFFIPNKKLLKRERVTDKIINLFECYNLDELLILISYVNSVCYSEDTEKIIATQKNDLEKYWITKFYNKSILYNQASLVNLLQIILSNNFLFINKRNIFWTKYFSKHIKLLQWFLLSNNLNALNWEKEGIAKHIIREYSPSYQKELFVNITNNRIDRYKHLLSTSCENKDFQEAFNKFVESIWISNMNSYITAIERQEVEIANYNSQNQLVISGMKEHLEHAVSEMIAEFPEISPVFLRVSAPFHCSHMKSIEPEFREFLLRYDSNFSYSYVSRVLSNFSGTFHRPETLIANLVSQISSPVLWTKNMEEISALGCTILEIGPNRVLSKFFSGAGNKSESVYDLRSFKKFIQSGSQECTL